MSVQCLVVVKRANNIFRIVRTGRTMKAEKKALCCSGNQWCTYFLNPMCSSGPQNYKNDKIDLEKVQKRAIKIRLLNGFFGQRDDIRD